MKQSPIFENQFSYLIQQSNSYKRLYIDANTTINFIALSNDNTLLAIFHHHNGAGLLNVWDLSTQKIKYNIQVPKLWSEDGICIFSKDNKYIFFGLYNDVKLQIISLESRRAKITDCRLGGALKQIKISINPKYCCTITSEQCLLWNQDTKKVDKKIKTNLDFICCCFKNNDKELITISYQEQEQTQFIFWNTKNYKILKKWAGKYISNHANCSVIEEKQILIVDYQDVYEHYIQIWSIVGQCLIRSLYQALDSFQIKNIFNSKLIVECEEDEDEEQEVDESSQNQMIAFFDILTFKYQRFKTFIELGKRYFILDNALIIENRKKQSNITEIFINLK
ncbi:unnamed protein product [Paramecium primaurelia]|uniref:WD40-repeat-containing domain n=1 Tax=Paramecium primaurelia TaxID=5886 RepID=A0A8S1NLK7_PARPR|nr:unnamed protein product [Paramecium primaurelia]